jgi:hypothetical protein
MTEELAREAIHLLDAAGTPVHFKQWGSWRANPYIGEARGETLEAKIRWMQARGQETEPAEKHGGCMIRLDGEFVFRQEQPAAFHELTERIRKQFYRAEEELATPPDTPLPSMGEVMTTLSSQPAFDLQGASDLIQRTYHLSPHHVKWKKPGATKSEFGRLVLFAITQLEDDGRVAWNADRAEWIAR